MRRRDFLGAVGGAALGPLAADAQQPAMPLVGFLHAGSPEENQKRLAAFRKGLADGGFVEGRDIAIDYRWAAGRNERLPELAAELVKRRVVLIVTPGSTAAAVAAKNATVAIPIVFSSGTDPVALGLVGSLSHPGGNATGVTSLNAELAAKRLGIFRELAPHLSRYFTLVKPGSELAAPFVADIERAAASLSVRVDVLKAGTTAEIDAAFDMIPKDAGCGMVFGPEGFFFVHRAHIAALALERRLPTMSRPGASRATAPTTTMSWSSPAATPPACCAARSRRTCRCNRRPSSSSSSTAGRRARSASMCRRRCSRRRMM
jgi:putative ABC transport system substrate-binding protein